MTFPEKRIDTLSDYCDSYFEQSKAAAASVDRNKLNEAAALLEKAYADGATVYCCGNGGSAAISNHLICDHLKMVRMDTDLVPRVVSLVSTMETITAIANDISYDDVFVYQLQSLGLKGDILITISSSGDSENVVRAAQWALQNNMCVISMTGFAGGRTAELADVNLHVEGDNYGVIEDAHQALMHILSQFIRQKHMDGKLIGEKKF